MLTTSSILAQPENNAADRQISIIIVITNEIFKVECTTSLLIAGVVLVPAIFHTLLPPCHPYITIHFMEMIFSTCKLITPPSFSVSKNTCLVG